MPNINQLLADDEILCQLAEEATELAQAALKYRRAMLTVNPTPKTPDECYEALMEEFADVMVCWDALRHKESPVKINARAEDKMARWVRRIREARENAV